MCGGNLLSKNSNLSCAKCSFVNYRNARPTVTAVILRENKILLTKRNNTPFVGWWDLPGGFVDHGESPEEAIAREMREELGMAIKIKKLLGIYPGTYPSATEPFYVLSVVYMVEPLTKEFGIMDKEELKGFKWFKKKELPPRIAFDSNQNVIREFKKVWK